MPNEPIATRASLASELRQALVPQLLERWYPQVVDEEFGGYFSDLSLDFEVGPEQRKPLVTQARHLWTTSKAAGFVLDDPRYARAADHGFRFLRDAMWDRTSGGFLGRVYSRARDGAWPAQRRADSRGRATRRLGRIIRNPATQALVRRVRGNSPSRSRTMVKDVYGDAFAIFGLAAYYRLSTAPEALELAQASFKWLERYSHDPVHGGYFRYLSRDGVPLGEGPRGGPPKDFNSSLHLMEAFTELYSVWPDDLVRRRLQEMFDLLRGPMIAPRGTGWVSFAPDWTPVRLTDDDRANRNFTLDHVSFGHDIEAAALLIDAADVLGLWADSATHAVAKRLVDHSIDHGWDFELGGLFEAGYYFDGDGSCEVVDRSKIYWAQAETLNTLSLFAHLYPDDPRDYLERFRAQWQYCHRYLLDHERGGWYWRGLDTLAEVDQPGKATPVRGLYHSGRALMNSIQRLET